MCIFGIEQPKKTIQLTGWYPRAQLVVGPILKALDLQFLAYILFESCTHTIIGSTNNRKRKKERKRERETRTQEKKT